MVTPLSNSYLPPKVGAQSGYSAAASSSSGSYAAPAATYARRAHSVAAPSKQYLAPAASSASHGSYSSAGSSYSAPAISHGSYSAPAISHGSYSAPAVSQGSYSSASHTSYSAPVATPSRQYLAPSVVSHGSPFHCVLMVMVLLYFLRFTSFFLSILCVFFFGGLEDLYPPAHPCVVWRMVLL